MALSVLYIGGTGQISLPCVEKSLAAGHNVTVLNRGKSSVALPDGVESVIGEVGGGDGYANLGDRKFDVVCQFRLYTPEQMEHDIATFSGRTDQYVFISSASAYQKPARDYIITEKTPVENPYWLYSRNKATCEHMLRDQSGMPWTIVRPSHTVRTGMPLAIGDGDAVQAGSVDGAEVDPVGADGEPVHAALERDDATEIAELPAVGPDHVVPGGHGFMAFEHPARISAFHVVHDQCRGLPPEARVRNDDRTPVLRDTQVLQVRTCRRDIVRQHLVAKDGIALEIEGQDARVTQPVVAVVDRPQPVLSINGQPQDRVEQVELRPDVRERHRCAVHEFEQSIAPRPRFRVHREEQAAVGADRDVTDRFGILEDDLKGLVRQDRRRREVGIRVTAAVTEPRNGRQDRGGREDERYYSFHRR